MPTIIIPDNLTVRREDFEKMTVTMAKLIMLLCSGEHFVTQIEYDPEKDSVSMSTKYLVEKE